MNWIAKLALVGGAIGLGYVAVTRLIPDYSCTNPNSACGAAIAPYLQTYQTCAQQYAAALASYLRENNANGTGLTQAQVANLNYLSNCMNEASAAIAGTAKQYNANPIDVLETLGEEAVLGALVIIGLKTFSTQIATAVRSGATAASSLFQTVVRAFVGNGTITSASASALSSDLPTVQDALSSYDSTILDSLAALDVLTAEEAATIISEDTTNIVVDFAATLEVLASVH